MRSIIEAILILKVALPIQPSFYQPQQFNAACSGFLQMSGSLPRKPKCSTSFYYICCFVRVVEKNNLGTRSREGAASVNLAPRRQQKHTHVTYVLSLPCSSNKPGDIHSPQQLSPLKWPLIKGACVLAEWRLSFTPARLLISEQPVSDTCQNAGGGGGHGAILDAPWAAYQQQAGQD